ncbi:MAG: deoxyguanosinetriphosphate triphosphohydrolase [Alphaproteobacteria bacterium]|nr:deoxyguanosinetriphosphate triphosphohydrolase [Alphaproteobacteria bacterium]
MNVPRAPYAEDASRSRGRLHAEPESVTRSPFRRDADRIIHSTAFRRLKHKTQVFVFHEGDHYRTRLTHTLEVTQIGRALARTLGLDEDLTEALALAHDLGHPPFGHAGERALDACLADFDGFDHNAQTLRTVTAMERRYPQFDGLNLTWETLEGIVKHNGPLMDVEGHAVGKYRDIGVPQVIREYTAQHDLALWSHAGAEAQVAAIADDIAYDAHDLDDGLRADLFALSDLNGLPVIGGLLREVRDQYPGIDRGRATHELVRRLIGRLIEDVVAESTRRFGTAAPVSSDEVRAAPNAMIAFSAVMASADRAIKEFLWTHMYRHPRVIGVMSSAEEVVRELFARYFVQPQSMPAEWAQGLDATDGPARARRVADFIAGMTDGFALNEHARLFPKDAGKVAQPALT